MTFTTAVSGTCTAGVVTYAAIPAEFRISTVTTVTAVVQNNGAGNSLGAAVLNTGGTTNFYPDQAQNNFAAAGCAVQAQTWSYSVA